jgi:predicted metal-binding transcription factor (methanogenesis marker protein 9)
MTAKFEIVKLANTQTWPQHNNFNPPEKAAKAWNKWRGKEIAIGAGVPANTVYWNCKSEKVYPVTDESLARMGFSPECYGRIFVCEHQFKREGPTA